MTMYKILGELVTYCSRCKMDLNHRITLMDGDSPKRVMCLTCQSEHGFKDPSRRKIVSERSSALPRALTQKAVAEVRQSREESQWRAKLNDAGKTPKKYSIDTEFDLDDLVFHPTFGSGLIVGFSEGEKVQIYFGNDGVKILKGKKSKSTAAATKPGFKFF